MRNTNVMSTFKTIGRERERELPSFSKPVSGAYCFRSR